MILLYSLLSMLLLIALLCIAIPFLHKKISLRAFLSINVIFILGSVGIYFFTNNHVALAQWLTYGKEHYELLVEYQQLGGVDGMIQRVQAKLKENPNDAQGWTILGKLYLMKNDLPQAKKALEKSHQLQTTQSISRP